MVEREDVIFSYPSDGVTCFIHAQAHGSVKVIFKGVTFKCERGQERVPDNYFLSLIALALKSSIDPFIKNV